MDVVRLTLKLQRFAKWRPDSLAINKTEKKVSLLDFTDLTTAATGSIEGRSLLKTQMEVLNPTMTPFYVDNLASEIDRSRWRKNVILAASERNALTYG